MSDGKKMTPTASRAVETRTLVIDSPLNMGKSYLVSSPTPDAHAIGFTQVVVRGCCDESEAARCALHHYGVKDTHMIKCHVEPVAAKT